MQGPNPCEPFDVVECDAVREFVPSRDVPQAVANADASSKATMLAKGIAEAMNCTAFGLFAAIVALLGFAVLNGKTQSLLDDINAATVQVMNLVVNNRSKINIQGAA